MPVIDHKFYKDRITELEAQNKMMREFARAMLFPNGDYLMGDLDGDYVQEMALKFGLLEPVTMNEPCGDNCACAEYDADFPAQCNRTTSLLSEVKK